MTNSTLLTTANAASLLGITKQTLLGWVKDGKIDAIRFPNGHWRFKKSDIERVMGGGN